jgi:hypothetical protein
MTENKIHSMPDYRSVLTDPRFAHLAKLFRALNDKWQPNPGQLEAGTALYVEGIRRLGIECGRKFGKSDWCTDTCWRLGNMIQNGQGYYFGAVAKGAREFIWSNERLQNWGPREFVSDINKTDMRLTFTSGTFVKVDGADEFRGSKGFNPDFMILDEAADYPDGFWHAMRPNFASKDCIVVVVSSPPWILEEAPGKPVYFCRMMDLWKKYMQEAKAKGARPKHFYCNYPSHVNAKNLPPGFLEQEEKELRDMGCDDIWEREYLARRVTAGGRRIVGSFKPDRHVYSHDELIKEHIERNRNTLTWITAVDPSQTLFGTLIMAVNPYTKEVFFLDEIAEQDENETTEAQLWPRIAEKEQDIIGEDTGEEDSERFLRVCDEAAKWWIVGCANDPGIGIAFNPTEKALNSIEYGVSLLRELFKHNLGYVSDRCSMFIYQLTNWRRDARGLIPEKGKDLIDCGRYGLHEAGYYLTRDEIPEIKKAHPRLARAETLRDTPESYAQRKMIREFMNNTGLDQSDNLGDGEDMKWLFQ